MNIERCLKRAQSVVPDGHIIMTLDETLLKEAQTRFPTGNRLKVEDLSARQAYAS